MRAACTTLALSMLLPMLAVGQGLPSPERTLPENRVLTHREQAPIVRSRIVKRFETVLPELMRREGIDMWIIVTREWPRSLSGTPPFRPPVIPNGLW